MKVLSPQPQTQLDLWSHLKVSQSGQWVSVQIPFPFYVDVLKLAQASGFYSKLLSAGKDLTKLGGGAGKRRISNYRAEEGISQRGHCIDREAHIERGQAGSGWLSQDPEAYSSNLALAPPPWPLGSLLLPLGVKGGVKWHRQGPPQWRYVEAQNQCPWLIQYLMGMLSWEGKG